MIQESADTRPSALGHLRVLEVVDDMGELCGKMFADMGADVVRVEPPGGAETRRIGPFLDEAPHPERSIHFWHYNTNKKSVTLSLDKPEGRELFARLVKTADILVESMPPGYMDDRGLSFDELKEVNPALVYVSISPFGRGGPKGHLKGGDLVGWASSGYMFTTGWSWQQPTRPWARQASQAGCLFAVGSALAATYVRWSTGQGQHVDISLQQAVAAQVEHDVSFYVGDNIVSGRRGNDHVNGFGGTKVIQCKDGWVHINVGWSPRGNQIVKWMDEEESAGDLTDEKWQDPKYRRANVDHVVEVVTAWAMTKTKAQFFHQGQARGLECAPLNSVSEVFADPQLESREFWVDVEHNELGREIKYPGAPYQFSDTPWTMRRRAPLTGEDNTAIYEKELSLSKPELTVLAEEGII
ncbi:MAG: CoA transferase [SAR202 cluster bacterium]|jgi:crotonobetainyl-CoA:carnitine CoA-transferase CaiB-like acyl-CoA transferase|nr:CoA transferase [SAR202 cluster bacterium]